MESPDKNLEKSNFPEVEFDLLSAEEQTDIIFHFCHNKTSGGFDWSSTVYRWHPKLKKTLEGIDDEEIFKARCREYVESYSAENKEQLHEARERFQAVWEQIKDRFFTALTEDFETGPPEEIQKIKARVSINPICPRYLDHWAFDVFYKVSEDRMKQICIHEIIHFLYFKKWAEVFPNSGRETFEGPHDEWKLSEILAPSIINNNKTIQEITGGNQADTYKEWQGIKIGEKTLVEYFGGIYRKHLRGEISFAEFLKKSWGEYQKNKDTIETEKPLDD